MQVDQEDDLPKLICSSCADNLNSCYQFKVQCEANDQILQSLLIIDEDDNFQYDNTDTPFECVYKSEPDELKKETEDVKPKYFRKRRKKLKIKKESSDGKPTTTDPEEELENHIECDICGKYISRADNYRSHRSAHFKNVKYTCDICNADFKSIGSMKKHKIYAHSSRQKEACSLCGRSFYHLYAHMKMKHNDENLKFHCTESEDCKARFPYKSVLEAHILKKHKGKILSRIHKLCTLCGKVLQSEKGYKYHMLHHSNEKPFYCTHCNANFRSQAILKRHERQHTDERPYPCTFCEKAFRTKNVLMGHIRIHTGEKPFVCKICNKAFRQKVTLNTHMKVH